MKIKKYYYKDVLEKWLEEKEKTVKYSTYVRYFYLINKYIYPYFYNIKFKKITEKNIIDYFNDTNINKLSNATKQLILTIIISSLNYGIENKYRKKKINININFKISKNKITYFTLKEQKILESYIYNNMNIRNLLILVALYTGIRIGELCALKDEDIDFINNTISINKTVQRVKDFNNNKTKLVVDIPKTNNSIRVIPVPVFIINLLKKYIKNKNNYIFTNSYKPKDPRAVEKYFTKLQKKLNINCLNFHSLRHTFATRLREQKVDIKVISELLGHSNWKITLNTYIHASLDYKKDSINELGNIWSNQKFV